MLVIQSYLDSAKELHFNILWPVYYRLNRPRLTWPWKNNVRDFKIMFENFLNYGSVVGALCLVYASNVAIEVATVGSRGPHAGPAIAHNTFGTIFVFCALPCSLWPAIYVGGFDGWLAGVISWVVFQIIGAVATMVLKIKGPLLGLHVLIGILSLGVGYYLTLNNLPWQ